MSDFYHYEHGYRARDGFLIAKTVEKGIHNQRDTLDESRCYTGVVCGNDAQNGSNPTMIKSDEADVSWLTRDLGKRYLIMETLLKRWPANMWVQTAAELVHTLAEKTNFGPDDIEEIIIDAPVKNRMWAPEEGFDSVTHAQFSIPYVIAAMLCNPTPGASWYTKEAMKDPKVISLMQRVKAGPSAETSPAEGFKMFREETGYPMKTVTITLKNGTKLEASMDCHLGHPRNMMSRKEFAERFRMQAAPALSSEKIEKAIEVICNIEDVEDIACLADLLN